MSALWAIYWIGCGLSLIPLGFVGMIVTALGHGNDRELLRALGFVIVGAAIWPLLVPIAVIVGMASAHERRRVPILCGPCTEGRHSSCSQASSESTDCECSCLGIDVCARCLRGLHAPLLANETLCGCGEASCGHHA